MVEWIEIFHQNIFYGLLAALALLELYLPCRGRALDLAARWPCNFGLFVGHALLYRFVLPLSAIAVAAAPNMAFLGVLPAQLMDSTIGIAVAVAVLDFSKYAEHWIFHRFRCLWRIHLVHHADTDLDVTTGERHHPLEILLTYPIMLALVVFLALPPEGVAFYAVLSSVVTIWSHADVRWPEQLQTIFRVIFVTPDMHEVHHSADRTETDSNYGVVFSIWDRTLGTYVAPTQERSVKRVIGLEYLRDPRDHRLLRTLALPFVHDPCTQQHEKPLSGPAE